MNFIIERTSKIQEQMTRLYNRLHHTAYIPKNQLMVSRLSDNKTFNELYLELETTFKEIKNGDKKKNRKMIETAQRGITTLGLSFMKIKNVEIYSTELLDEKFSLKQLSQNDLVEEKVISTYLSIKPEHFLAEIEFIENRVSAYHYLMSTFLEDLEHNSFILDELQTEVVKYLAKLSKQLNTTLDEKSFWNGLSNNIAKHYILPVFLKGLTL